MQTDKWTVKLVNRRTGQMFHNGTDIKKTVEWAVRERDTNTDRPLTD